MAFAPRALPPVVVPSGAGPRMSAPVPFGCSLNALLVCPSWTLTMATFACVAVVASGYGEGGALECVASSPVCAGDGAVHGADRAADVAAASRRRRPFDARRLRAIGGEDVPVRAYPDTGDCGRCGGG
jgi:hypothetical protein